MEESRTIDFAGTPLKAGDIIRCYYTPGNFIRRIVLNTKPGAGYRRGEVTTLNISLELKKKTISPEVLKSVLPIIEKSQYALYGDVAFWRPETSFLPYHLLIKYDMNDLDLTNKWVLKETDSPNSYKLTHLPSFSIGLMNGFTSLNEYAQVTEIVNKAEQALLAKLELGLDLREIVRPFNKELKALSLKMVADHCNEKIAAKRLEILGV